MKTKRLVILGSTGSIGQQTLDVVRSLPDHFEVFGLAAGSNVTLFGEGPQGGQVTLNGSVEVGGSANRIRGARLMSALDVPGSDFGFSFSRVSGAFDLPGSDGVLLNNAFCGTITIGGSGTTALGNAGMAPVDAPSGGC